MRASIRSIASRASSSPSRVADGVPRPAPELAAGPLELEHEFCSSASPAPRPRGRRSRSGHRRASPDVVGDHRRGISSTSRSGSARASSRRAPASVSNRVDRLGEIAVVANRYVPRAVTMPATAAASARRCMATRYLPPPRSPARCGAGVTQHVSPRRTTRLPGAPAPRLKPPRREETHGPPEGQPVIVELLAGATVLAAWFGSAADARIPEEGWTASAGLRGGGGRRPGRLRACRGATGARRPSHARTTGST